MTWLRLLASPLVWAAVAGLLAAVAWGQFQRANAADAQRRAAEEASRILSDFTMRQREREAQLLDAIGDLADVEDTNVCVDSPALRAVGDRLRALGRP